MRRSRLSLGLIVVLGMTPSLSAAEEPTKAARETARQITQLGSVSYEDREEASRALDEMGTAALPLLRKALQSEDAEVCRRAAALIEAIELREVTKRLLRANKVRLSYKDVKVSDAIADLARRTGNSLQLNSTAAASRKITLDTGEVTYWEALAKLCDAAGLRERLPDPAPAARDPRESDRARPGRRVMFLNDGNLGTHIKSEGPIILEEGKGPLPPMSVQGALRVRALPPKEQPKDGRLPLVLEFKPDASVSWEAISSVRIDRAIDDQGQALEPSGLFVGKQELMPAISDETILVVDGEFQWPTNRGQRLLPISFQAGKKPSKSLRELHGTVGAWVRTPAEELLRLDDPAKSLDKTLRGADGAAFKLVEMTSKGEIHHLRIELSLPPPLSTVDMNSGPIRVVFMARPDGPPKATVSDKNGNNPFTLLDARGQVFSLKDGSYRPEQNGSTKRVYTLTYQCRKDQGPPARLIYSGPRNAFVEVPSVLKDVPLAPVK